MDSDKLKKYNEKRSFDRTAEPPGEFAQSQDTHLAFVVQKHAATRLHYDFRLEWQGVMLSWAVPKGPSYNPASKRLAVRTEDHPVSYNEFEGIIAENQYGAGPVMIWDAGLWQPLDKDPDACLKKGKLSFQLTGKKLTGEWTLARMGKKQGNKENWLLIKRNDEYINAEDEDAFLTQTDYSVKSGLTFAQIAAGESTAEPAAPRAAEVPQKLTESKALARLTDTFSPQLATLADKPPATEKWTHEVKYDGYRILVYRVDNDVRISTRNGHNWTDKFPALHSAFQSLEVGDFVIDAEAVVINQQGLSDFKLMQQSLGNNDADIVAYCFDLLYWKGEKLTEKPFTKRREALERLFQNVESKQLFITDMLDGDASDVLAKACELGLEGIISKKQTAKYTPGRSKTWLKSKCEKRQEFIICGFERATNSQQSIGSLHLGYYDEHNLTYAGKVGTGFSQRLAKDIFKQLNNLRRKTPPFDVKVTSTNNTVWVKPALLCEVKFATWTATGKVRHASFQGLRADKVPEQITRETPKNISGKPATDTRKTKYSAPICKVKISNPEREIFPQARITKGELAEYYANMDTHILPTVKDRPISVVRCPGGIDKQCFFQRSKGKGMPEHIHVAKLEYKDKSHEYMYLKSSTGLVELVQMGAIEVHPWGAKIDKVDKPDKIIFDLDPDEAIPFEAIKLASLDVKRRLAELGLESFLKCTGGKGLHIVVPIKRRYNWDTVKAFAKRFAATMVEDVPDAYTINTLKKKRIGKIFIDYLRNDYAATAVMDYAVRARKGAPVAVPLDWSELDTLETASQFSIKDVLARKRSNALFKYPRINQSLTKEMLS